MTSFSPSDTDLKGGGHNYFRNRTFCPISFPDSPTGRLTVDCPAKLFFSQWIPTPPVDLSDSFTSCITIAAQQVDDQSSVSPTSTLASPASGSSNKLELDKDAQDVAVPQSRLSDSYPAAYTDFYGLPSNPPCVFKTGDAWTVRPGPERVTREVRPVGDHPIGDRWLEIGQLIYEHLDSHDVKWSSIDPVRFAEAGERIIAAKAAAQECKVILAREGFPDVEIAFRESVVFKSGGPKLLSFNPSHDPVPEFRRPFSPTLGIQIAPLTTPHYEGTGAVYLRESSQSENVFLLTARHVACPPPVYRSNKLVSHKHSSQPRQEIVILGTDAYTDAKHRMTKAIALENSSIAIWASEIEKSESDVIIEGEALTEAETHKEYEGHLHLRGEYESLMETARKKTEDITKVYEEVAKFWSTLEKRVIGYVVHAPPIAVNDGPGQFTRDWALIKLYRDKIDWNTFPGNKVYLGGKFTSTEYNNKMHPHPESRSDFKYPPGGLLQIKGVVKDDEIRKPQQLDDNGEKCLFVIKNGKTDTTLGRLTGMFSFLRSYPEYFKDMPSIEIAVHPLIKPKGGASSSGDSGTIDGAFSASGDSGAIVGDSKGRAVGMITGGTGATSRTDITYLTPYWWIEEEIKKVYPKSYLFEIVDKNRR
ncbi:hypothetical protein D9615_004176 [Tricholomella constricta]|uniref:Uncharacterized protein n=1 Tax=Tricholomella constricta TaxID=117010 RepID=A0A8H5HD80_9AGAR|nr:hypothetical protein D9615_004176 [Tricholomella constricta]